MSLSVPVVWSDRCLLHEPGGEVWIGVPVPGDEVPERARRIRDELTAAGAPVVAAGEHDDDVLRAVHDERLVEFLRTAWQRWVAAGTRSTPVRSGSSRTSPRMLGSSATSTPSSLPHLRPSPACSRSTR